LRDDRSHCRSDEDHNYYDDSHILAFTILNQATRRILSFVKVAEKSSLRRSIWIKTHLENMSKTILIVDGPGVPQDSLNKIFEPFFRVDDSRNRSTGGVGLGLAIAHRSIISHDGRIWAENANPGLVVRIQLPVLTHRGAVATT